jgi:putative Mg2+ transporter-C (MgtC) family protein
MSAEIIVGRIVLAGLIGLIIGAGVKETANTRLFMVISVGAALVAITSANFFIPLSRSWFADPGRLSAQIIAALGFIGSGLIWISPEQKVKGLSTAAALWLAAIIGLAVGAGYSLIAISLTIVLIIFNYIYRILEEKKRQ